LRNKVRKRERIKFSKTSKDVEAYALIRSIDKLSFEQMRASAPTLCVFFKHPLLK
jgi:hypothetical protein